MRLLRDAVLGAKHRCIHSTLRAADLKLYVLL